MEQRRLGRCECFQAFSQTGRNRFAEDRVKKVEEMNRRGNRADHRERILLPTNRHLFLGTSEQLCEKNSEIKIRIKSKIKIHFSDAGQASPAAGAVHMHKGFGRGDSTGVTFCPERTFE